MAFNKFVTLSGNAHWLHVGGQSAVPTKLWMMPHRNIRVDRVGAAHPPRTYACCLPSDAAARESDLQQLMELSEREEAMASFKESLIVHSHGEMRPGFIIYGLAPRHCLQSVQPTLPQGCELVTSYILFGEAWEIAMYEILALSWPGNDEQWHSVILSLFEHALSAGAQAA